jgi:hypothetical protein
MRLSLASMGGFAVSLSLLATSPTPSIAIPAGTGYLGCYVDSQTERIMSV